MGKEIDPIIPALIQSTADIGQKKEKASPCASATEGEAMSEDDMEGVKPRVKRETVEIWRSLLEMYRSGEAEYRKERERLESNLEIVDAGGVEIVETE